MPGYIRNSAFYPLNPQKISAFRLRILPVVTSAHPYTRTSAFYHRLSFMVSKDGVSPVGSFQPATGIFPCHYDFLPPKRGRYAHSMVRSTLMPLDSLTLQKFAHYAIGRSD